MNHRHRPHIPLVFPDRWLANGSGAVHLPMAGTTLCWPGDSGRSRINLLARDSSHQQRGRLPRLPRCL
jgi:hypothetical protein